MSRSLASTLLRLQRPERVRLFHELTKTQWLSREQLADISRENLTRILRHSAANVPRYRDFCREAGLDPENLGPDSLTRFPLVTKQDMTRNLDAFKSAAADPGDFVANATGGSSGVWFRFFIDRGAMEVRTANDLRGRTWTGWNLGDKQAVLWGHPRDNKATGSLRGRLLSRFVHRSANLDAYDMDERVIAAFYRTLRSFNPAMMLGYASALAFLTDYLAREGLDLPAPRGIISSAETLTDRFRSSIEGYFDCPLLNRYGSREFGDIAQQCGESAGLHVFNDRIHLEILRPDGSACDPGEPGEIVVTDLDNTVMPFIRYRTGDVARPSAGTCACGRGFPLLESVEGRTSELIVGKNGKYYSFSSPRLFGADIPGVGQMQLIQESLDGIEIKVIPDSSWNPDARQELVDRITGLLGDIEVEITLVDQIPPAASGKVRFAVSKVSPFTQQ